VILHAAEHKARALRRPLAQTLRQTGQPVGNDQTTIDHHAGLLAELLQEPESRDLILQRRQTHDHAPLQFAGRDPRALERNLAADPMPLTERRPPSLDPRAQRQPILDQRRPGRQIRHVGQQTLFHRLGSYPAAHSGLRVPAGPTCP
jgi:hypothetical protein